MFRFEHPEILYLLVLSPLPAIAAWFGGIVIRRRMALFGQERQVGRLLEGWQKKAGKQRLMLWTIAYIFVIGALANPQLGTKPEAVKRKGVEVFIALDLSQSMLAEDIAPNRLERARRFVSDLALELRGNKTGLIVFAGSAYLQVPLTTDYAAIALFANSVSPASIPDQGTNIAAAAEMANRYFSRDSKGGKVFLILSDGEDHEDSAVGTIEDLQSRGVTVFTFGLGTAEGGFIPVESAGGEDYKRDEQGVPVRSALNAEMLRELAREGNGSFYHVTSERGSIIRQVMEKINRLEKRDMEQRIFTEYKSYFQPLLFFALLLLLLEWLWPISVLLSRDKKA